ncbi:hypothetical protein F0562_030227 [Nyssa sinensis]|uniref:Uncharacterized protein n=1 Tax=Nyssa sinensis TaxID=561372 RepID=A0A5J5AXT9_9ASTE|nr:hypothetical protein F0562_030227 [Nyssa sinensis]
MASISILNWSSSEQRWADQMSRIFNEEVVVEINEDGVQVFEVPKSISVFKPNAYTPLVIGLGPYHHFRPQLYLKQRFKLARAREVLKPDQTLDHFQQMINELKALEPNIRAFYDQYLDLDPNTLASLFAIDGLFLLDILHNQVDSTGYYLPPDTISGESSHENLGFQDDSARYNWPQDTMENEISGYQDDSARYNWPQDTMENENSGSQDDSASYISPLHSIPPSHPMTSENKNSGDDKDDSAITRDILMLENQIPTILLKRIQRTLQRSSYDDDRFFEMLKGLCRRHSPLKLAEKETKESSSPEKLHLLGLMHHLIINRRIPRVGVYVARLGRKDYRFLEGIMTNCIQIVGMLATMGVSGAESILTLLTFIESVPWDLIASLLGKEKCDDCGTEGEAPKVEKIKIPSVSQLSNLAKISFHNEGTGGIRDIRFHKTDSSFSLPPITLNDNSEVILRNLVAYESTKPGLILEFTEYVDLMSGIIRSEKDVSLLREKEIIQGSLTDKKIFHLFNGMNKSSGKPSHGKSDLQKTVDDINEYFDNNPKTLSFSVV